MSPSTSPQAFPQLAAQPVGNAGRLWSWCRRNPSSAIAGALAVLALVTAAVVSTIAALSINQARRRADGLRLTAISEAVRASNPGLALLLAIEGGERAPGDLSDKALRPLLEECRELRTLVGHPESIHGDSFRPDGKALLSWSNTSARFWDVTSGKELREIHRAPFAQRPGGRRVCVSLPSTGKGTLFSSGIAGGIPFAPSPTDRQARLI